MNYRSFLGMIPLFSFVAIGGCASKAEDVSATYVSSAAYNDYSCSQLREEAQNVSSRAAQAAGAQDQKAQNDKIATAVTVVVFLPAALFINGNGANAAELARLKGQIDAIEEANIRKHCKIEIRRS